MIKFWKFLHEKKSGETKAEKVLREKYRAFLTILAENEHALGLISELENKYYGKHLISIPYLKNVVHNLSKSIENVVENLLLLSPCRYNGLMKLYENLEDDVRKIITGQREPLYMPVVIPMTGLEKEMLDKVGSKMVNLGELRKQLGLNVPEGFAVTACAFQQFIDFNTLIPKISAVLRNLDIMDSQQLMKAEKDLKTIFINAHVPMEVAYDIQKSIEKIEHTRNKVLYWAVRSSAIGEDMENSFAGQFSTVLNVKSDDVIEKYKEVLASKYNARAIAYRQMKSIRDEDLIMSAGVMEMIHPHSSGVLYTANPVDPDRKEIIVNAVWGLGQLLVEGVISTDTYVLQRSPGFSVIKREIAEKELCLIASEDGGVCHDTISDTKCSAPCLNEDQLRELAEMAIKVEEHFQYPQDIEWCFNEQGKLYFLQARPLHVFKKTERLHLTESIKASIVTRNCRPVSPGVGMGKVFKLRDLHDLVKFPEGAVLVTKNSSPRLVRAMHRSCAIVVEKGSSTDHMASLAREFKMPCVVKATDIFSILQEGQEVTVDATNGIIYQGNVTELPLNENLELQKITTDIKKTESYRLLKQLAKFVIPLHLTDPRSESFALNFCKTWHDILRFCHDAALNEMFSFGDMESIKRNKGIYRIETRLPFQMYVLDLLDETVVGKGKKLISLDKISSIPFQALCKGMTHPNVPWSGPGTRIHLRDMATAMTRISLYDAGTMDTRSYAVVTKEYLNLNMSMGFHYVVLDCYLSEQPYNNYISLSFKGGAAEARKRRLRVVFVKKILKKVGFYVQTDNDFLKARVKAEAAEVLSGRLDLIGRMLGVTRLLDVAMTSEETVNTAVDRFFQQDYTLGIIR